MKTQYQICLFATAPISVSGWICGKLRLGSPSAKTPPSITRKRQAVGFFVDKQANSSCQNRRQKFAQNCEERHSVCVQGAAYWSCIDSKSEKICGFCSSVSKNLRKKCVNSDGKIPRQKCVNHKIRRNLVSIWHFY